jgi:LDH2 family malate/lactate/ureidoglycolate dehydrogenase
MSAGGTAVHHVPAAALRDLLTRILERAGTPADVAAIVATSLVASNERGVDSHGCIRIPEYLEAIENGKIDPGARPTISREGAILRVEGNRSFGQYAAGLMTAATVDAAHASGVAVAALSGVKHVGRLGEFVELAAEAGCVALLACNGGPPGGLVAPFGGRGRAFGTNPLAFGIPAGAHPPIVADFSTSVTAEGKVRLYRQAGEPVPTGWLIDAEGNPTVDAGDLYAGGAILPAADHKGFALGLLVEILGGVLAGEGCAVLNDDPGNGGILIAIEVSRFRPGGSFAPTVDAIVEAIEAIPPAPGFESVVVPGAPERRTRALREQTGIPLLEETWSGIARAALGLGIELESAEVLG